MVHLLLQIDWLWSIIKLLTNNLVEINNWDEVKISNEIYRMTKRLFKKLFGIEIERESTIGRAKKKLGENDFYIYENNDTFNNIDIGENKYLEGFKKAYGQLLGYLNYTFKFGFTISISKTMNLYHLILVLNDTER